MRKNAIMDRTWLTIARRERGLTQAQVAAKAGITTAYYNRIEMGLYLPNVVTALLICDALGVSVRKFLSETTVK